MKRFFILKTNFILILFFFFVGNCFAQTSTSDLISSTQTANNLANNLTANNSNVLTGTNTTTSNSQSGSTESPMLQLALSDSNYMVTAGDTYVLVFNDGSSMVNYPIIIDGSYKVRIINLGVVNAAGKTYREFKNQVETMMVNNFPLSYPQLTLRVPAIFNVYVNGEIDNSQIVSAWGLMRVSDLLDSLKNSLDGYSSTRDITITSETGKKKHCDLFLWERNGDLTQNPYLRPGDKINIGRKNRSVTLSGAVERPGTYELLKDDNLKTLIDLYGGGFKVLADKNRIELTRVLNSKDPSGDKIFLTDEDLQNGYDLDNFDKVDVSSVTDLNPVFFVEGAVVNVSVTTTSGASTSGAAQAARDINIQNANASTKVAVPFVAGETYNSIIMRNKNWFSPVSDTQNAYIIRRGQRIPINLDELMYDLNYTQTFPIEENDTLLVPFKQFFVNVAGAVLAPNRYPYIPDRSWEYYIGLAGGFDPERNTYGAVKIVDSAGNVLKKTSPITPETTITAKTNSFLYYFNRYAPVVTTILTVATTAMTAYLTSRNIRNGN